MNPATTPRMGWLCSYTPVELIMAAGFTPHRITGHNEAPQAADTYMSPNMCHYVRSTIDMIVEGKYDGLAGVVFVTSCDAMRRLHDTWRAARPAMPLHVVDLPIAQSAEDTTYFAQELGKLRSFLERVAGKPVTPVAIARAITSMQRARAAYHALEVARASNPTRLPLADISLLVASLLSGNVTIEAWTEQATAMLEKGRGTVPGGVKPRERPRVVLAGCPVHDRRFLDIVEGSGMDVVQENNCTGSAIFDVDVKLGHQKTAEGLLEALASAYISKPSCARMMKIDERVRILVDRVHQSRAEGIIHYALKFCDTYQYDVPQLKQCITAAGIKFLAIEDDCTASSAGQLRTRLEAFKEILANEEGNQP
jgi:benzoyl-CoA reductase/2-hydroxyglutaryl-CoA dehydratase subunit BcrC/BadD/HgdB